MTQRHRKGRHLPAQKWRVETRTAKDHVAVVAVRVSPDPDGHTAPALVRCMVRDDKKTFWTHPHTSLPRKVIRDARAMVIFYNAYENPF